MRILYITTIGGTMRFFKSFIEKLIADGNTVEIATNMIDSPVPDCYKEWGCKTFQISCSRSPLDSGNLKAVSEIKRLVTQNHYDIVHCHTPIAAACTRLACRNARKTGTKVIYTAHGFHFYKGAPLKNWLLFYPVEKVCSYFTDTLITINTEDYKLAKRKFAAKSIQYVPGVGIDVNKFANTKVDRVSKRKEIGVPENAFMLLSVGELSVRKNHKVVIEALNRIDDANFYYVIVGEGVLKHELMRVDKTGRLRLLGYRKDIAELMHCSDLFVFPSLQEGLPVALMESMACGIPCLASKIRGNTDLLTVFSNALVDKNDIKGWENAIRCGFTFDANSFSECTKSEVENYNIETVNRKMKEIYKMTF